ncbi:MAG: helix-turn-helix domain-containing protein [Nocardioides alkalitolerans]
MTDAPAAEAWSAMVDGMLAAADELVERQCDAVGAIAVYRALDRADVATSARRNVLRAAAVLRGDDRIEDDVAEAEEDTARRRALQGVPSADMLAAYRRGFAVIRDVLFRECRRAGLSTELTVRAAELLWECADRYSSIFVAAQHEVEMDLARREESRRATFLSQLLVGALTAEEAAASGAAYGLGLDGSYWVLRIHGASDRVPRRAFSVPERAQPLLVGSLDEDVVAVVGRRPPAVPTGTTAGVDGPASLADIPEAFRRASHALTTARAFGLEGLYDEGRLAVRAAVLDQPRLSRMLLERYVVPVEAESAMAATLLSSVDAYLEHGRSLPRAARALSVHLNSLRYRIERFTHLTGADFDGVECVIEVWWALRARELRV